MDKIKDTLDRLESAMGSLDGLIGRRLLKGLVADKVDRKLTHIEKARLYVLLAYTLETYLYVVLKMTGHPVADHAVMQDLAQIRAHLTKIKMAEGGGASARSTGHGARERRLDDTRSFSLDRDAATRFINHAIRTGPASVDAGKDSALKPKSTKWDSSSDSESSESSGSVGSDAEQSDSPKELVQQPATVPIESTKKRKAMDPFAGYDTKRSHQ